MTRVSSHQLLDAGISSIQQQSVEAMKWQQQIASGKRFAKTSEGAVEIARGVEIQFDKSKYSMLKTNQDFVATRMALADAQLGAMHDVLADMQQISVQARDAAIGKIGLQSLAQRARAAYEQLAQQSVAMDTNDERYLLKTTNVARLSQPFVTSKDQTVSAAAVSEDAIFVQPGTYKIDAFSTRSIGGTPEQFVTEARMQVNGRGPDGSNSTYFIGTYDQGSKKLQFSQNPDWFFNLGLSITGDPSVSTELTFQANPVVLNMDTSAKMHAEGDYTVELDKGEQFINGDFTTPGVNYTGGSTTYASIEGWEGVLPLSDDRSSISLSEAHETPFGVGSAAVFFTVGAPIGTGPVGPTLASKKPVNLLEGDRISFRWNGTGVGGTDAIVELLDSNGVVVQSKALFGNSGGWTYDDSLIAPRGGAYTLRITAGTQTIGNSKLYIDDIRVESTASNITSATLKRNGTTIKTISEMGGGVTYDSANKTTSLNFGNADQDPPSFYGLSFTMVGDPRNLRTTDTINFRVDPKVKQIEIEPGIWVPEGISFREALGNTTRNSRDVLADARAFVESLERAAVSGTLESDFTGKIANLDSAADQVLKYQIRAGVIGAQVDAAKAALEVKATELEAHRSRLLDTDIAEASAGLVRTQTLLEAARSIFARLESSNLFQRLM
jgi:flagellin-like hook-associated protein FlgL